jgi:prophage maintenance system killer protein
MKNEVKTIGTGKGQILLYQAKDKGIHLEVRLEKDTLWLTQQQISELFGIQRPAITKHFHNIFKAGELSQSSVCSILEHTAADGKTYKTTFYNLDAIISVGYRVNSRNATRFRIWATNILKQHLVNGYTINSRRLKEQTANIKSLQRSVEMLADLSARKALTSDEAKGLFQVIRDYSYGLDILDDYDHGRTKIRSVTAGKCYQLDYQEAIGLVEQMRQKFGSSRLFGHEKDTSFQSALGAVYQTFSGKELYASIEEKAANLLYLVVKNHAFSDGNKRIAAALFIWFLDRNKLLYKVNGEKRIADNAMVAITLMIAESHPREKDVVVSLVANLINKMN